MGAKQIKRTALLISALIIVVINSCGEGITEPQPGRRDYVWTVDTLITHFNTIQDMWGNSNNNIYVVGPGGEGDDRIWHYDGKKWNKIVKYAPPGIKAIYGFSNSNIWFSGFDGNIYNFDGTNWELNFTYKPQKSFHSIIITDIYGNSPSEIYAVGVTFYDESNTQRGFVLKYNGVDWKEIYEANYNSQFLNIRKDKDKVMIFGIKSGFNERVDTLVFWQLSNNNLREIYSSSADKITFANFSQIGNDHYYIIGKDINRYENDKFIKVMSITEPNFAYAVFGRSEKDFFVNMIDGLAHYNGTNIEYLYRFKYPFTYLLHEPFISENEVFYILYEAPTKLNLILHGKLKE